MPKHYEGYAQCNGKDSDHAETSSGTYDVSPVYEVPSCGRKKETPCEDAGQDPSEGISWDNYEADGRRCISEVLSHVRQGRPGAGVHQLRGMQVCPMHGCILVLSSVSVDSHKERINYRPAEHCVVNLYADYEANPVCSNFSRYLGNILLKRWIFSDDISVNAVLFKGMKEAGYISRSDRI